MTAICETKQQIEADPENWVIHLMDFVDDFRYYKNPAALAQPFESTIGSSGVQNAVVFFRNGKLESDCVGGEPIAVSHSKNLCVGKFFE